MTTAASLSFAPRSAGLTDVGLVRDHNEDAFVADDDLGVYIVCDGVGGHAAGEVASQQTVAATHQALRENADILRAFASDPSPENRVRVLDLVERAIAQACREVYEMAQKDRAKRGMGTTIVLLIVAGQHAVLAHVGDSRIYLSRAGRSHQLTEDHSLAREAVRRGTLTPEEAERSPHAKVITRAVGYTQAVQIDKLVVELLPGDAFVLCSDGLCDYLKPGELEKLHKGVAAQLGHDDGSLTAADGPAPESGLVVMGELLIKLAKTRGGRDNITAIVVEVPRTAPAPAVNVTEKLELLHRIPLFSRLSYKELVKLMEVVRVATAEDGRVIVRDGELGDTLYVALSGTVSVRKGDTQLAELGKGSFFGEMAIIDREPRSADIVALGDVQLLTLSRDDLYGIWRDNPAISVKMLWSFCRVINQRLRSANAELAALQAVAPPVDLDMALIELVEDDFGEDAGDDFDAADVETNPQAALPN
jgi:PPM family protein phosphatase